MKICEIVAIEDLNIPMNMNKYAWQIISYLEKIQIESIY